MSKPTITHPETGRQGRLFGVLTASTLLLGGVLVACGPGENTETAGTDDQIIVGEADPNVAGGGEGTEAGLEGDAGLELDATAGTEQDGAAVGTDDQANAAVENDTTAQTEDPANATAEGTENQTAVGGTDTGGAGDQAAVVTLGESLNVMEAQAPATAASETELELAVGERYEIRTEGQGDLMLENDAGDPLLATGDEEGTFEQDQDVAFEGGENSVTFTLTEELAQELAALSQGEQRLQVRVQGQ